MVKLLLCCQLRKLFVLLTGKKSHAFGAFVNLHLNTALFSIKEPTCFGGYLGSWVCYELFSVS